jgi:hypothetical protein
MAFGLLIKATAGLALSPIFHDSYTGVSFASVGEKSRDTHEATSNIPELLNQLAVTDLQGFCYETKHKINP